MFATSLISESRHVFKSHGKVKLLYQDFSENKGSFFPYCILRCQDGCQESDGFKFIFVFFFFFKLLGSMSLAASFHIALQKLDRSGTGPVVIHNVIECKMNPEIHSPT